MTRLHCLYILVFFILYSGVDAAKVISLDSDDIDGYTDYDMRENLNNQQSFGELHILLNTYIDRTQSKNCAKVLTIQLTDEFYLDAVVVSCDINPPFPKFKGVVNIADIIHISAEKGSAAWAVFKMEDMCVQRTYTDDKWSPLEALVDVKLTAEQCAQAIAAQTPGQGVAVQPPEETLPPFDKTQGKLLMIGDVLLEQHIVGDKEDKEMDGESMKMIVTRTSHHRNGQCMDVVYVDLKESEDMLDCAQVTCDDKAGFVKAKGLIVYGGLVYVRDHPDDAVWAVFRLNNRCELRLYTDKKKQLIIPKARSITLAQCREVVETQNIDFFTNMFTGLSTAQQIKPPAQNLVDVQQLISQRPPTLSPPPPTTPFGSLPPQPVGSASPSPPLAPQPLGTPQVVTISPINSFSPSSQPVTTSTNSPGTNLQATLPSQPMTQNQLVSSSPAQPMTQNQLVSSPPAQPMTQNHLVSSPPAQPMTQNQLVSSPPAQPMTQNQLVSSPSPPHPPPVPSFKPPTPLTPSTPTQLNQPAPSQPLAPPSVYFVYSPPPPPPPESPSIIGGLANKFGGFFRKFGSPPPPPPPAPKPTPTTGTTQTPSVPVAAIPSGAIPITPITTTATPVAVTPVSTAISAPVPPAATAPPSAPAPVLSPPPKKPWWYLF